MEVLFRTFLISKLHGGEGSASLSGYFTPWRRSPAITGKGEPQSRSGHSAISMVACTTGRGERQVYAPLWGSWETPWLNKKFWEELNAYFPFITNWGLALAQTAQKISRTYSSIVVCTPCRWNVFTEPFPINRRLLWLHYSLFQAPCHIAPSLRLLSNFSSCNVGITDGRNLCGTPLRWARVPWYTYRVSLRLVQAFKAC
jgi:hypothetical protein